ncbi:hypothetical protein C8R44DRAFT_819171 [Mycena epipterygia]|nr:hypothetical protein C8R44DRAFT_819171 [Mycena epipterygia]
MSCVVNQVVVIPNPAEKFPANPFIRRSSVSSVISDTSDGSSWSYQKPLTKEEKIVLNVALAKDSRSFLTFAWVPSAQACRIINTVRRGEQKDARRKQIEDLLTKFRFCGGVKFLLDGIQNIILAEPTYHYDWDLYALLAYLPADLEVGLHILTLSNRQWFDITQIAKFSGRPVPPRPDNADQPQLFPHLAWDVILPYPTLFLSESMPLAILSNPTLPDSPLPSTPKWKQWFTSSSIYLVDADGNRRPPFKHTSSREPHENISVFAMIVNADSKIQHALSHRPKGHAVPQGLTSLARTVHKFVQQIFFDPAFALEAPPIWPPVASVKSMDLDVDLDSISHTTTSTMSPNTLTEDSVMHDQPASDGLTDAEFDLALAKANEAGPQRIHYIQMLLGGARPFKAIVPPSARPP